MVLQHTPVDYGHIFVPHLWTYGLGLVDLWTLLDSHDSGIVGYWDQWGQT
jgi:hypothetical protein